MTDESLFAEIKTLTEMSGPVGQEQSVLAYVAEQWRELGAELEESRVGNVLARVGGSGPSILLAAHADELCYLVRAIDDQGYIWLANGQAWQRSVGMRNAFTIGQRVRILSRSGEIPGVIATTTGHLATLAKPEISELTWRDIWVDTGLSQQDLAARGVTPGTRIVWDSVTQQMGRHVVGKALDDRVLLVVLTEVLRRVAPDELKCSLTLAATVQEEIGLIGASALAAHHEFDAALALEVGLTADIPGVQTDMMPVALGQGPVLVHKDALVHYDYRVIQALEQAAEEAGIEIQHAVFGSFGSDGAAFMRADIPAGLVAFPTRYTHTPFETAHLGDIENLVEWVCAFVRGSAAQLGG